jgi:hypothetical protein
VKIHQPIEAIKRQGVRLWLLTSFGLITIFNLGCSTPSVPYTDPNPPEVAWQAYQTCINALPPTTNASACDYVGTSTAESASAYTNSGEYVNSNGQIQYKQKSGTDHLQAQLTQSYKVYLAQIDAGSLAEMTQKWSELSASHGIR